MSVYPYATYTHTREGTSCLLSSIVVFIMSIKYLYLLYNGADSIAERECVLNVFYWAFIDETDYVCMTAQQWDVYGMYMVELIWVVEP